MTTMTLDEAFGWFAVQAINSEFPHPDEPIEDEGDPLGGCCVIRCGPCGALSWLSKTNRGELERVIRLTGYTEGGWCFWDDARDVLRWDLLEAHWARHQSCGVSNGVLTGCSLDEETP